MSTASSVSAAGRALRFENAHTNACGRRCLVNPLDSASHALMAVNPLDTTSRALMAVNPLDSPNSPFAAGNPLTNLRQGHEPFSCIWEKGT